MTAGNALLPERPLARVEPVKLAALLAAVFGGPVAWFLQLCAGYALATQPCFREGHRVAAPAANMQWSWPVMIGCMIAAILIALSAFIVSFNAYRQNRDRPGGIPILYDGAERTRFLALWGIVLGIGFALITAFTAVAFATLPRCAG